MKIYKSTINNNRIMLNSKTRLNVPISVVIMLKGQANHTIFVLNDGSEKVVAYTLKYFESFLKTHDFQRIHRATMIDPTFIKKYDDDVNIVTMKNDMAVKVSRRKKGGFLGSNTFKMINTLQIINPNC